MRNLALLLLLCITVPRIAVSQDVATARINGNFQGMQPAAFFTELEKQVSCRFYYDLDKLDSFVVNVTAKDLPLKDVLTEAFKGTDIRFSIDDNKNIFVTKTQMVVTELPKNFFQSTRDLADKGKEVPDSIADYGIENKRTAKAIPGKLIEIGRKGQTTGNIILTGHIRSAKTGEPLVNASVFTDSIHGTTTDLYGQYSLTIPAGSRTLNVQSIGMKDTKLQLLLYSDGKLDVDINEEIRVLKEVVISNRKTSNIRNVQMGVERLSIANIKNVPTVFGEADVLRVITSLPGVKTVGEASTGFNVRGGSTDQNLILFNEATIYNPSHFFGLFSAFNPEVIKDIQLYKSSIPAKYGGRLSSVLDISSREGNKKKLTGSAGIGVVTSRIHLEGPIAKDKTSFILGARTTYANWLLKLLPDEYRDSKASFQDVDLSITHTIDSNNIIYASGYYSYDRFSLGSDTTYSYSNKNGTIKWKHAFSNKFTSYLTAGIDQYEYSVSSKKNEVNAFKLGFDIEQLHAKMDFEYYVNSKHSFDFGVGTIRYKLRPGFLEPVGSESLVVPDDVQAEQALESNAYFTHRFNPGSKLSISSGLRYSLYNYLGPKTVSSYTPGAPVTETNRTGIKDYKKGKFINSYYGPEVRFSVRYAFSNTFSAKAAYNTLRQYIHLLSNTTIIAPTDIWKLSDPNIRPQYGEQVSFGLYKNFKSNTIETSAEIYYKRIKDYLDYKPGATLILNHNIETDVVNTKGKAYGVEVLIKKPGGKLNGWISYTYSRILLRAYDTTQGAVINGGEFYPANYDKPHDVTLAGNFRVNHRFSVSLNFNYSTGRPITLPIGRYYYAGAERVLYSDRNAYRIQDYIRTDFAMNIDGNHKVNQKTHNSWTIGFYNLLGRKNPYSVYFVTENAVINGYKLSIFGSVIPFINFNIRF
ncbi:MAG: carboxypeptidase-like regulatory domain-containing protein [Chitinophagaceae bacterium]